MAPHSITVQKKKKKNSLSLLLPSYFISFLNSYSLSTPSIRKNNNNKGLYKSVVGVELDDGDERGETHKQAAQHHHWCNHSAVAADENQGIQPRNIRHKKKKKLRFPCEHDALFSSYSATTSGMRHGGGGEKQREREELF